MRNIKTIIKQWAAPVLCGFFIFILFKFVFFIGYVPTESMEPTIKAGSCIFGCRIIGEIRCGDIFVFKHNGYFIVKRVAAIPGDIIYINDTGQVGYNNEELSDAAQKYIIPDGCYFVIGDNPENSVDSRRWTNPFIEKKQIIAKIWK